MTYYGSTREVHHHHSTGAGVSFGGIIAAYLSYTTWHSVGWAILHFFCSWIYVIYWLIAIWNGS